ncbi:MAG: DUF1232 domain-containing protein [SAR202 cluster bacterium]|jgi:uncharacterized membrane protein YkvA (DUF1232 family)|nr:MAG: DUF1232 domain-containing protein [SAR202 cluster bacterium]MQG74300.1 DUF1232 domain-containing protein [SAR202 cluster bacterium]
MTRLVTLFLRLMLDRRVPWKLKLLPLLAIGYAILPWDFLPDLIPFIGWIDDIAILIVATLIFLGLGSSSTAFSSAQNPDGKNKEKPKGQVFDGEYRVIDDDDKA